MCIPSAKCRDVEIHQWEFQDPKLEVLYQKKGHVWWYSLKDSPKNWAFCAIDASTVFFLTRQVNELNKKPIQSKEEVLAGDF